MTSNKFIFISQLWVFNFRFFSKVFLQETTMVSNYISIKIFHFRKKNSIIIWLPIIKLLINSFIICSYVQVSVLNVTNGIIVKTLQIEHIENKLTFPNGLQAILNDRNLMAHSNHSLLFLFYIVFCSMVSSIKKTVSIKNSHFHMDWVKVLNV